MRRALSALLATLTCTLLGPRDGHAATVHVNVTASAQVITSPNYPNNYPNNLADYWICTASPGTFVVINIIDISLQSGTPCPDQILIEDSTHSWNRTTCTATFRRTESFISLANMNVNFTTDASTTNYGFKALITQAPTLNYFWSSVPTTTCQSNDAILFLAQVYDTQYFTLPYWPNPYGNNWKCIWHITAPPEHNIWLRRFKFELGEGDTFKIWNGKRSFIFCEDAKWEGNLTEVFDFVSNTDNLFVEYRSDGSGSGQGFFMGFEAIVRGDKIPTKATCDGEGLEILISCIVCGVVLAALIIGLLIWAKKNNRICVAKTRPYYRPETPVATREVTHIRPETPPPPPKAPPKYARANQPMPMKLTAYRF